MNTTNNRGFTLIEVILIVAILAGLMIAIFVAVDPNKRISDARNTIRKSSKSNIEKAIQLYAGETFALPTSVTNLTADTYYLIAKDAASGGQGGNCPCLAADVQTVNVASDIAPTYLSAIPLDPSLVASTTNSYSSGYWIKRSAQNIVTTGPCYDGSTLTGSVAEYVPGPADPSWDIGVANFRIYESNTTTWGAGTLKCSATLTDTETPPVDCTLTTSYATYYRVEFEVINNGGTTLTLEYDGDLGNKLIHVNACRWAQPAIFAQPTQMDAAYNDFGGDDDLGSNTTPAISSACNGGGDNIQLDLRSDQIIRIAPGEKEGFAYVLMQGEDYGTNNVVHYPRLYYNLGANSIQSTQI